MTHRTSSITALN